MSHQLFLILGGIGLFIFGMDVMTDALRAAASGRLRRLLSRFTTTPLRGALTGTAATALIQSSSATTVMTVGFVGAGLLSFPHALGVLFGANIGTTFTGWMVTLLGFKLKLGTLALPGLFAASLMILLGRGAMARAGRVLAGLCLLFIGLDLMQEGAAGYGTALRPGDLPAPGLWGQTQLMLAGLLMTVVMQSSSAALAIALVFLVGGSISFAQAAAMVIGMNLGTTITAIMASLGGSVTMRQTAIANTLFNIVTALLAFPLLWLAAQPLDRIAGATGPETALVLFHTAFNVVGTALFLPVTHHFAALVQRILPDDSAGLTSPLDRALLGDANAALDAAHASLGRIAALTFAALGQALQPQGDLRALAALGPRTGPALDELQDYIRRIDLPDATPDHPARDRHTALLHQIDHLRRIRKRAERTALIPVLMADETLNRPARHLGTLLRLTADEGRIAAQATRLRRLSDLIAHRSRHHRRATLLREHVGTISLQDVFDRTDAMRWLNRISDHAASIASYDGAASHRLSPGPRDIDETFDQIIVAPPAASD